jgi:hypothetical protein
VVLHSVVRSSAARGNRDLAIDCGQVGVDSAGTDDELFSYLCIGESLGHQAQHLDPPGRQSIERGGGSGNVWN